MPRIEANGTTLHYEESGSGPQSIVFVHGLSFHGGMFEGQIAAFRDRYRCITFDLRGHGQSPVAEDGYDMDVFTDDAVAVIEKLGAAPCHFVGWSIGGFMGLRLALRRPDLLRSLVLIGAAAIRPSDYTFGFKIIPFMVKTFGMKPVIGPLSKSMFASAFLKDPARRALLDRWKDSWRSNDKIAVSRTARGVLRQANLEADLPKIGTPTLTITGEHDAVCIPAVVRRTADAIPGATYVSIPGAGHACTIEEPQAVSNVLREFLERVESRASTTARSSG
jgi:pimeloyl-ACP methyl ester carboxylesterase